MMTSSNQPMRPPDFQLIFSSIKGQVLAFCVFMTIWSILSFFFEDYTIPAPLKVWQYIKHNPFDLLIHFYISLKRVCIGFVISFLFGTVLGIGAYLLNRFAFMETTLVLFQVLPGTIIGIILLLLFGVGSWAPIALIIILTTPLIAIQTATAMSKTNLQLRQVIQSFGGGRRALTQDLYLPMLVPTFRANLSTGMVFSIKVVLLGEFIGSEDGIGYLLSVATIYFNMPAVFACLCLIVGSILLWQVGINVVYLVVFRKFLNPD
ncbi:ABC transporter permease subunit [Desulfobacterales bacterium HSG17]|nr:ABC transporter permease subunit [Desulfobacterales bacterium HSG17]